MALQHKVTCVAQYELISRASNDAVDDLIDCHGSVDATVQWSRHSALLQEPPLDVIATLVTTLCLENCRPTVHLRDKMSEVLNRLW